MKKITLAIFLSLLVFLAACRPHSSSNQISEQGDTLLLRHAKNLVLIQYPHYLDAVVRNPWDSTQVLRHYRLSTDSLADTPEEITPIVTPIPSTVVFSGVHAALLRELGCAHTICGVCDASYMKDSIIIQGLGSGKIQDLGSSMMPNIERFIDLNPALIMAIPFEHSGGYGAMEKLGIPILECAEYMEVSPLAQAEWMRFYGRLFGRGAQADSLFAQIEATYLQFKEQTKHLSHKPLVISELPYQGKWHVAAGESTTGQLYQDAGARYAFSHIKGSGSKAYSIEQVLDYAMQADIWLVKHYGSLSRAQLWADYPVFKRIPAQLWVCNSQQSSYFEETPFHPDWLLAHLIQIFHPSLPIQSTHTYFEPLP